MDDFERCLRTIHTAAQAIEISDKFREEDLLAKAGAADFFRDIDHTIAATERVRVSAANRAGAGAGLEGALADVDRAMSFVAAITPRREELWQLLQEISAK